MEIDAAPISRCSKAHEKIYQEWFSCADSDGDGRITGGDATKFFAMSKLSRQDLKQIWSRFDVVQNFVEALWLREGERIRH